MNGLFTTLAIVSLLGALGVGALLIASRRSARAEAILRRRVARWALPLAAAVATVSTAGSLYYSEVAGYTPCTLCWVQRGLMYPLVVVLATAGFTARRVLLRVGLVLAGAGTAVAAYHWSVELNPSLLFEPVCSASVPCTAAWVWELGFVSIAFMAMAGFAFIAALLVVAGRASSTRKDRRRRSAASRADVRPAVAAGVAAGAVALAGLLLPNPADSAVADSTTAEVVTAPVTVTGDTLPPFTTPAGDAAVGQPAPELSGSGFGGEAVDTAADGRPKAILFLAHWCPHCQDEVPVVKQWLDENGPPDGIDLYSVSTGVNPDAPNYPPNDWLGREGWTVPVLADDDGSAAGNAFGLTGFPYWVFVAGDGTVTARHSGALPIGQLTEMLDDARSR